MRGLCNALTDEELLRLKKITYRKTYKPGELILSGDDDATFYAGVVSGVVKLTKILVDGRQQIVGLLFPSDSLGHAFSKNNPYFADAATEVELCCFERVGFERMIDEFSGLKHRLLEQTLDELNTARDWMITLGRKTAEEKVASLLLMLATRSTPSSQVEMRAPQSAYFEIHLKRHEIADFLGLTYETVCRQIAHLKKKGVIKMSGKRQFAAPDIEKLSMYAG